MKIDRDLLYIVTSSGIGEGEADLGARLAEGFFKVLAESDSAPAKIIFMNAGIFMTTQGSSVGDHLKVLQSCGTEIISCTTCLNYFDRFEKLIVGRPGDMKETVHSISTYRNVVSL
jgi:selenium metabolism protein YedF